VASAAPRGGLRDGRYPDRRAGHLRVGRGYHTREVETFGAPLLDQNANREMFEERGEVLRLALGYQFHIAASRRFARRAALRRKHEDVRRVAPGAGLTDKQIAAMRDPRLVGIVKVPTIEDAAKAGGFLAGRPEDIVEQLKAVEERYPGLDRVTCATPLGTPLDVQLEDLDRFAKEVIPAFRDTRTAAAAQ
jgi:hypothetical protein